MTQKCFHAPKGEAIPSNQAVHLRKAGVRKRRASFPSDSSIDVWQLIELWASSYPEEFSPLQSRTRVWDFQCRIFNAINTELIIAVYFPNKYNQKLQNEKVEEQFIFIKRTVIK